MTLLDKLAGLMEEHRDTVASLSRKTGLAYTTIDGLFKKGFAGARIGTVQAIARAYGVSLDYMIRDEITDPHFGQETAFVASFDGLPARESITDEERMLIAAYRAAKAEYKVVAMEILTNHKE